MTRIPVLILAAGLTAGALDPVDAATRTVRVPNHRTWRTSGGLVECAERWSAQRSG
ncbi:hypothetical protein [Methylobacterium sp. PvR107]|uniref:hypothetical protein n=1 Tax=Methylobacterium sp. PvR107 TaxID=2806597 RepID=UPI001AEA731D|nr:hypothetical protein [Methylobacterium sp. PvR107]MBP1180690.1 hypothetical protein [Methylobacterium sp. PvR107]